MNAPEPVLTSSTSASQALGELLGQDRGDDQRDRLDRAGRVAHRVQAAVGGREVAGLADDRAAGLAHHAADAPRSTASTRSRGSQSSLSSVPPVWPSPRPEIIGTAAPQAARIGARISETLSPTPPVECLSSDRPVEVPRRARCPESRIAVVSATRSSPLHPAQEQRHRERADLGVGQPAVGDPGDQEADLLGGRASRRRACGG